MKTVLFIVEKNNIDSLPIIQLQSLGYSIIERYSSLEGVSAVKEYSSIDIVVVDLDISKGIDGVEAAAMILASRELPLIFMSDKSEIDTVYHTEDIKSYGFIVKNSPAAVFHTSIRTALELFEAHSKVKESEEKYKSAFQTSPDAVNINDIEGRYVDINNGFTELTSYTREDVIGRLSGDIGIWAVPGDRELLLQKLKEHGAVDNLESQFRCKDGSFKTALMSARIITINSKPHILSITRDITERKAVENRLAESERLYRTIVQTNVDGYLLIDDQYKIADTNDSYCRICGYSGKELIGKPLFELIGNETIEDFTSRVKEINREGQLHFSSMHKRKNGALVPVKVSVSVFPSENQSFFILFIREI